MPRRSRGDVNLRDIKELRHVSRRQFVALAQKLRTDPTLLNDASTLTRLDQHMFERFEAVVVRDTYELEDEAGTFILESCDPGQLVQLVCAEVPSLAELYLRANRERPCTAATPWHVVVGFDEFTPGRPKSGQQSKKTMCLYFNFAELGFATLMEDATWMCPLVVSTEVESCVEGGWSRIFADFLERLFFGPTGFLTAGVPICFESGMMILYAQLGISISDGDGLRKATAWKGASCMRPCFKHDNVLMKNSGLLDRLDGWYEITHHVPTDFHLRSAESLFDSADKVAAAHRRWQAERITKAKFEKICKSEALNFHPLALPWRLTLRRRIHWYGSYRYDWVHTLLQEGALTTDMFLYLSECSEIVAFSDVCDWLKLDWIFPAVYQSKGRLLHGIFSEWRTNSQGEHDKLHASCSELLGCYQLVRLFLEMRVPDAPERAAAKRSFLLCCRIVDIFQAAKKQTLSMLDAADRLEETLIHYMMAHKEAYGIDNIRPKFHWLFDLILQLRRDGMLHDQLVVERLHLRMKEPAEKVDNLRRWERSVLAEALNHQIQDLRLLKGPCHVMDNKVAHLAEFPNAVFCNRVRIMGMTLAASDVVFWQEHAGMIVICGLEDDDFFVLLELWTKLEDLTAHASTWTTTGRRQVYEQIIYD